MTFIVRVTDPTAAKLQRLFDLDDKEGREAFARMYGEDLRLRSIYLEEGQSIQVLCFKRVDDWDPNDDGPSVSPATRDCPFCHTRPEIMHEHGRGFLIRCPECGTVAGKETWSTRLADAIARWNGGRA